MSDDKEVMEEEGPDLTQEEESVGGWTNQQAAEFANRVREMYDTGEDDEAK